MCVLLTSPSRCIVPSMIMQVILVGILCAVAGLVSGGNVVAWPPSAFSLPALRTALAPATQGFAYSTTQYINTLPGSYYGIRPQVAYQPPIAAVSPLHSSFYPFTGATYFPPAGAIYYPQPAPILQQDTITSFPGASFPSSPIEQPSGDSDTAVIDSAQYPDQSPSIPSSESNSEAPAPADPTPTPQPQFPPAGAPVLPSFPQFPGFPSFPQFPQESIPNFPSIPQLPTSPPFTQPPSTQPASPSADREDKGLNDEDTVSVESA